MIDVIVLHRWWRWWLWVINPMIDEIVLHRWWRRRWFTVEFKWCSTIYHDFPRCFIKVFIVTLQPSYLELITFQYIIQRLFFLSFLCICPNHLKQHSSNFTSIGANHKFPLLVLIHNSILSCNLHTWILACTPQLHVL